MKSPEVNVSLIQKTGSLKQIYADIITNHQKLPEDHAREAVLKALLTGTTVTICMLLFLLLLSYFIDGNRYIGLRIVGNLAAVIYLCCTGLLVRARKYYIASLLLVAFYGLISIVAVWQWGIHIAFAILLMSLTITLTGILLGARSALYAGAVFIGTLLVSQSLIALRLHIPDSSWQTGLPSEFGEAAGYCLLFLVLTLVSWLFGQQVERSLYQARQAEAELLEQKKLLATKLKERTEKLRTSQLKEMQQLYRFAELGQFSTALFHELANHLSVLTLDLEDLKKPRGIAALTSVNDSVGYIDRLVDEVRQQLHRDEHPRKFGVLKNIEEVVRSVQSRFAKNHVKLIIECDDASRDLRTQGDPTRFGQVITILVINALEAIIDERNTPQSGKVKERVEILISARNRKIEITISDWGAGVTPGNKSKVFKAFYGTKKSGMGIGLFITKQIIETHFSGNIRLVRLNQPTQFKITLPRKPKIS